jgi:hypothetical protein
VADEVAQEQALTLSSRSSPSARSRSQDAADEDFESNTRFLHNYVSPAHTVVQLAHVMYSYVSPVLFFYVATSSAATSAADGGTTMSAALSSVIFYGLAVSCQIQQHGQTSKVIKNLYVRAG